MLEGIKAKKYWQRKNSLFFANIALLFFYFFIMIVAFSAPLQDSAEAFTKNSVIVITMYVFSFHLFYFMLSFGLKFYENFVLERDFCEVKQTFKEWFNEVVKKELKAYAIFLVIVQMIYFFLETDVGWWWFPAGLICVATLSIADTYLQYILCMFLRIRPVRDQDLKKRIDEIAQKVNFKIQSVSLMPQFNTQAEVVMLNAGPMHKLFLSDRLDSYAPEEISVIVAREIARHHYGHIWKIFLLQSASIFLTFYV